MHKFIIRYWNSYNCRTQRTVYADAEYQVYDKYRQYQIISVKLIK